MHCLDHRQRSVPQLIRRHDGVDSAFLQRNIRLAVGAGRNPLDGSVETDHTRQAHGAAEARKDAKLHFRQADIRGRGHDPEVARQGQLRATAKANPIDRRDARHGQVFEARPGSGGRCPGARTIASGPSANQRPNSVMSAPTTKTPLPEVRMIPLTLVSFAIACVAAAKSSRASALILLTDSPARSNLTSTMPSSSAVTLKAGPECNMEVVSLRSVVCGAMG